MSSQVASTDTETIITFYDVTRPENMSPEHINNDVPPPAYDVVRQEYMGPQYETVEAAKAAAVKVQGVAIIVEAASEMASLEPPPLPPPMIRADSESPSLPAPYDPTVDRSDNEESIESRVDTEQEKVDKSLEALPDDNTVSINLEADRALANCYDEVGLLMTEQKNTTPTSDTEHSGHSDESADEKETIISTQVCEHIFVFVWLSDWVSHWSIQDKLNLVYVQYAVALCTCETILFF